MLVTNPANLAYDPVRAGSQHKDIIWIKDPTQWRAIEIPGGTSGQLTGAPVLFPAACPASHLNRTAARRTSTVTAC